MALLLSFTAWPGRVDCVDPLVVMVLGLFMARTGAAIVMGNVGELLHVASNAPLQQESRKCFDRATDGLDLRRRDVRMVHVGRCFCVLAKLIRGDGFPWCQIDRLDRIRASIVEALAGCHPRLVLDAASTADERWALGLVEGPDTPPPVGVGQSAWPLTSNLPRTRSAKMSVTESTSDRAADPGLQGLRENWGWFLGLGILLLVLGTVALGSAVLMTLASVLLFGWLLIIGGVMDAVQAFRCKGWSGFFLDLLTGVSYLVVGFMVVANPEATAVALTLLIAMFLIMGGLFRIVAAIAAQPPHWGWVLLHGVVSLLLGVAIWQRWPLSGLWVIGLYVGIEMIFNGWSLVMLGLTARRLRQAATA
ncbi:MAG: DUF308 domain-containing protein [Planctomycetota bacterium]